MGSNSRGRKAISYGDDVEVVAGNAQENPVPDLGRYVARLGQSSSNCVSARSEEIRYGSHCLGISRQASHVFQEESEWAYVSCNIEQGSQEICALVLQPSARSFTREWLAWKTAQYQGGPNCQRPIFRKCGVDAQCQGVRVCPLHEWDGVRDNVQS